jgi:hypothetical protein
MKAGSGRARARYATQSNRIEIGTSANLAHTFGTLGCAVGPRTGPDARTHEQREWWCMRRYIFTLAEVDRLEFPISIEKGERPDFRCEFGSRALGIEVAEATHWSDQREMTEFDLYDREHVLKRARRALRDAGPKGIS